MTSIRPPCATSCAAITCRLLPSAVAVRGGPFSSITDSRCWPAISSPSKPSGCRRSIVLFFIEMGSRRVHLAGCTPAPDSAWVTQQARNLVWQLADTPQKMRFLIHDHDTKFSAAFDRVFAAEGIEIVLTPVQAPKANAVAERWVRSVREEGLDQLLILNARHLRRVLTEYVSYYNSARPHQGLDQQVPTPFQPVRDGSVHRRDVLGGIIHDYYR